jgi:hypothetical protein
MPVGPKGAPDQFAVSHEAGGRVQNLMVLPAIPRNPGDTQIHRVTMSPTSTMSGYQRGDDGTRVFAGVDVKFEDVGTLEPGALEQKWTVLSDVDPVVWPERTRCKSTATAPGYAFEKLP